ncbi:MAG: class I SAM-dependent methyltransferase [Desulfovermiculus sp.]
MNSASTVPSCPLCFQDQAAWFHQDRNRSYFRCPECHLVYVPQEEHVGPDEEKARYDRHTNQIHEPGYRTFLSRILDPLRQLMPPPALGLDFGCGPGPALAAMAREGGYTMAVFDPFYAPDPKVWNTGYDFITCTEVVEHLRQPGIILPWIWPFVRPGGLLAIMTKLVLSQSAFAHWHYIRDETHVSFFSHATFQWLAAALPAGLSFYGQDVIFLHKPE